MTSEAMISSIGEQMEDHEEAGSPVVEIALAGNMPDTGRAGLSSCGCRTWAPVPAGGDLASGVPPRLASQEGRRLMRTVAGAVTF